MPSVWKTGGELDAAREAHLGLGLAGEDDAEGQSRGREPPGDGRTPSRRGARACQCLLRLVTYDELVAAAAGSPKSGARRLLIEPQSADS